MAWDLEIVYSGLCLFYRPRDGQPARATPQVLLVETGYSHEYHHQHTPQLCFHPSDLDDLSIDKNTLRPTYDLMANEAGDHLVSLPLEYVQLELELSSRDQQSHAFHTLMGRNTGARKPSRDRWNWRDLERDFRWVAPLGKVHQHAKGIRKALLETPPQMRTGVVAKMLLHHGTLGSHRLGWLFDDYSLWQFYPNQQSGPMLIQALADQVSLRLKGLQDEVKLKIHKTCPAGLDAGETYLKFPTDLDGETVRLGITNLPAEPEAPAEEILTHFRAYYPLLEPKNGHAWPPDWKDRPAPLPWTSVNYLGSNGNGQLCPCAECD